MTIGLENSNSGTQRTRRNIMKIGAILAPVALANIQSIRAAPVSTIALCRRSVQLFPEGDEHSDRQSERKIEDLASGDLLPTCSGLRAVQWIGRYPFKKSDPAKAWVKAALPIRIARSALAPDLPHADLYVTAAHSLLIDGVLVPAEALVNGTTITRYEFESDELEFFHIKLESHDVIYAEGAPTETLLCVDELFVNFADYLRRYGTPVTEAARCAPLVHVGGRDELK